MDRSFILKADIPSTGLFIFLKKKPKKPTKLRKIFVHFSSKSYINSADQSHQASDNYYNHYIWWFFLNFRKQLLALAIFHPIEK